MLWSARKISIQREPAGSHNFYLSTKSLCFEGKSENNDPIDFVTVTTWCTAPYIEINLWYQGAVDTSFKVSLSGWYPHFTVFRGWAELIYKLQTRLSSLLVIGKNRMVWTFAYFPLDKILSIVPICEIKIQQLLFFFQRERERERERERTVNTSETMFPTFSCSEILMISFWMDITLYYVVHVFIFCVWNGTTFVLKTC